MKNKSKEQKINQAAEENEKHLQSCTSLHAYWPSSNLMTRLYFHCWVREISKKINETYDEKSLL